jgi:hypothetical protein
MRDVSLGVLDVQLRYKSRTTAERTICLQSIRTWGLSSQLLSPERQRNRVLDGWMDHSF